MIDDNEFRKKISSSGFLTGLWFAKKTDTSSDVEKMKFIIKEEKRAIRIVEDKKQVIKNNEKKQRLVEWKKDKKKMRYVDIKTNPQKGKNRWYNWYDVANKITKENDSDEIKRWKYE